MKKIAQKIAIALIIIGTLAASAVYADVAYKDAEINNKIENTTLVKQIPEQKDSIPKTQNKRKAETAAETKGEQQEEIDWSQFEDVEGEDDTAEEEARLAELQKRVAKKKKENAKLDEENAKLDSIIVQQEKEIEQQEKEIKRQEQIIKKLREAKKPKKSQKN